MEDFWMETEERCSADHSVWGSFACCLSLFLSVCSSVNVCMREIFECSRGDWDNITCSSLWAMAAKPGCLLLRDFIPAHNQKSERVCLWRSYWLIKYSAVCVDHLIRKVQYEFKCNFTSMLLPSLWWDPYFHRCKNIGMKIWLDRI